MTFCGACLTAAYDDLEGLENINSDLQREVCADFGNELPDHNCEVKSTEQGGFEGATPECGCACNDKKTCCDGLPQHTFTAPCNWRPQEEEA